MLTWKAVEILGQCYYAAKGYRVLISQVEAHVYNFVVDTNERFFSVNVKCASRDKRCERPTYSISRKKIAPGKKHPDVYLVWFAQYERFIELPGAFLKDVYTRNVPRKVMDWLCKSS